MLEKLKKNIPPEVRPFELKRTGLLLGFLLSVVMVVVGVRGIFWYAAQMFFAFLDPEMLASLRAETSKQFQPIVTLINLFDGGYEFDTAKRLFIVSIAHFGLFLAGAVVCWELLRKLELKFRAARTPALLEPRFSEITYDPKRHISMDEPLCELELLEKYERYYVANRLEAMYRDSLVLCDDVVCGGVYGRRYSGRKIKIRGQWMTFRLTVSVSGTVLVQTRDSANRLSFKEFSKDGSEVRFNYSAFTEQFRVFAQNPEEAQALVTKKFADRLLKLTESYPDFCVIFSGELMYVLLRRKSFQHRIDIFLPYLDKILKKETDRLYNPVCDFADTLLH